MSNLGEYLDASEIDGVAASSGRPDPIPANEYIMALDSYEFKETGNGTGMMFVGVFKVLEGEYEGRIVWSRFNIKNANAQAQSIGRAELVAFREAIGMSPEEFREDTASAQHQPFIAKVVVTPARKGKDGKDYDAGNEIRLFRSVDGAAPSVTAAPAAKPAAPAASPASKPPAAGKVTWAKKAA